jgi:hypothetical protein
MTLLTASASELSTFDPDRDVCGLSLILIATSARTCEGRFPVLRAAFVHRRAFGNTESNESQESLLYFRPLERVGRRALAGIGCSDGGGELAGDPAVIRETMRHHVEIDE